MKQSNRGDVKKILKMSPSIEVKVHDREEIYHIIESIEDENLYKTIYECGDNKIKVYYYEGLVAGKSFNE
jgi:hypothetical protein